MSKNCYSGIFDVFPNGCSGFVASSGQYSGWADDAMHEWRTAEDEISALSRNGNLFIAFIPLDDSFGKQAAKGEPIYRRRHGLFG